MQKILQVLLCATLCLNASPFVWGAEKSLPHLNPRLLLKPYKRHLSKSELHLSKLTWSPNRKHAFYTIQEADRMALYAVRRDGTYIRKLCDWTSPGKNHPDNFCWSPDSSRVLMYILNYFPASSVNADGVKLIDIHPETGKTRKLSLTEEIIPNRNYYRFSPNGKDLLLVLGGDRFEMTRKRLVRIEYQTGKHRYLTPPNMASVEGEWSPDGQKVVYISMPDNGVFLGSHENAYNTQHLYLVDREGKYRRQLTQDSRYRDVSPSWSKDGQWIYFVRYRVQGEVKSAGVWRIRPNGKGEAFVRNVTKTEDLP